MHTVFALLCFVVVIHWLISPYPSGLLRWHCGNLTIAPVPAKQPWWIWINTSCEFIMNDCITTTKQSTTKPCAYFLGFTVCVMTSSFTGILLFLQQLSEANSKEKIRAPHYWPFVRGIHQWLVVSIHKGSVMQNQFPCHNAIMSPDTDGNNISNWTLKMHQWIGSSLVQIMACCLFGASHYLSQCWLIVN